MSESSHLTPTDQPPANSSESLSKEAVLKDMLLKIHEASWTTGQERPVLLSNLIWNDTEQAVWVEVLTPGQEAFFASRR